MMDNEFRFIRCTPYIMCVYHIARGTEYARRLDKNTTANMRFYFLTKHFDVSRVRIGNAESHSVQEYKTLDVFTPKVIHIYV